MSRDVCMQCVRVQSCPTLSDHQAPLSMGLSWQESWRGLPFPAPGHLPDPGIEPVSPASGFFTAAPPGSPYRCVGNAEVKLNLDQS